MTKFKAGQKDEGQIENTVKREKDTGEKKLCASSVNKN